MAGDDTQNTNTNTNTPNQDTYPTHHNHNQNQHHHHHHHYHGWPEDDNPFVAIRRFADEQISSVLQSVTGLPSSINPPSERWAIFDDRSRDNPNNASGSAQSSEDTSADQATTTTTTNTTAYWSDWDNPETVAAHHHHFYPRNYRSDADFFFNSFFDRFWLDADNDDDDFGASRRRLFQPFPHRPMLHNLISDASPAWPVPYLMFSPYSPLHLERRRDRARGERGVFSTLMSTLSLSSEEGDDNPTAEPESEPRWRDAFEDLLRLENGKPMLERADTSTQTGGRESGKDWLQGLVQRGSLGDRWKYVSGEAGPNQPSWSTITFDNSHVLPDDIPRKKAEVIDTEDLAQPAGGADALAEQDLYDRFLDDLQAREQAFAREIHQSPLLRLLLDDRRRFRELAPREGFDEFYGSQQQQQQQADQSTTDESGPSTGAPAQTPYVIATQTRTERVRLPDGAIQTKTIRKKRFSDGREETNENVDVVNPRLGEQQQQQQPPPQFSADAGGAEENKDGWFWKG
ncbi:hypothetical protein BO86DRAFT_386588 [Aspergillus japonicus CBS 114.51]|uniref:Uncharacterized protein n=1 Tax=Aspergillus japonicus CBS 114.51 TaxID=1448312 RepID=A0A8T8XAE5_ASPJA|nr:hypothetical protein BO86DRAFT_386588 [Aspergillus japonicus CBS 114.51]RAH85058.1 hypothetical protein BO86DRAFT_386588 [Aspergillus japonicus CBS 114.51]